MHLVSEWEKQAQGILTKDTYNVHLTIEDAARIDALAEMYPKRTKEQLIRELLSAALNMVEESFPYVQGNKVIATDGARVLFTTNRLQLMEDWLETHHPAVPVRWNVQHGLTIWNE